MFDPKEILTPEGLKIMFREAKNAWDPEAFKFKQVTADPRAFKMEVSANFRNYAKTFDVILSAENMESLAEEIYRVLGLSEIESKNPSVSVSYKGVLKEALREVIREEIEEVPDDEIKRLMKESVREALDEVDENKEAEDYESRLREALDLVEDRIRTGNASVEDLIHFIVTKES